MLQHIYSCQATQAPAHFPWQVVVKPGQQACPVGVPYPRGLDYFLWLCRRNLNSFLSNHNLGAALTFGHDHSAGHLDQVLVGETGFVLDQGVLIVVHYQYLCAFNSMDQILLAQAHHLLAWVVYVGNANLFCFFGMLYHGIGGVGGDHDCVHPFPRDIFEGEIHSVGHGSDVERGNLVVLFVGVDEERGCILVLDLPDTGKVQALLGEPCFVLSEVLADGAENEWIAPKQFHRVGDVRCHSASLAAHGVHEEAETHPVYLIQEEVVPEMTGEMHQVVVGYRA